MKSKKAALVSPPISTQAPFPPGGLAAANISGPRSPLFILSENPSILSRVEHLLRGWKPPGGWLSGELEIIDLRMMIYYKLHIRRSFKNGEITSLQTKALSRSTVSSRLLRSISGNIRRKRTRFNHISAQLEAQRWSLHSQYHSISDIQKAAIQSSSWDALTCLGLTTDFPQ